MIARAQHRHQRAAYRRHARSGGKGILGPLQRRDPLFEHPGRGVAIAGIDKLILGGLDEPRFGGLGAGVDKALSQKDRFGHLAILAAAAAFVNEDGLGIPWFFCHRIASNAGRAGQ